ncbi:hypothetical protein [uncultured Campylobacter sp.]|nr:hypothetical protein [uncultured Campylobacter sp.]
MSAKWGLNFICGAIAEMKFYPSASAAIKFHRRCENKDKEDK